MGAPGVIDVDVRVDESGQEGVVAEVEDATALGRRAPVREDRADHRAGDGDGGGARRALGEYGAGGAEEEVGRCGGGHGGPPGQRLRKRSTFC
ncbi:predicted protein [Streptomyces sp. SPB78]|nr:predicted protein [Streptomyces sp. SPB78]